VRRCVAEERRNRREVSVRLEEGRGGLRKKTKWAFGQRVANARRHQDNSCALDRTLIVGVLVQISFPCRNLANTSKCRNNRSNSAGVATTTRTAFRTGFLRGR